MSNIELIQNTQNRWSSDKWVYIKTNISHKEIQTQKTDVNN